MTSDKDEGRKVLCTVSSGIELRVKKWIEDAKVLWSRRDRPEDATVIADFTGGEVETGEWLVTFREFEISPERVRQLSVSYHFLSTERMDYFLFSFLRGNLISRLEADVSVERAAIHISRGDVDAIIKRFDASELHLIRDYFLLIAELRGGALDEEEIALRLVSDAISAQDD
jgi:hypothetical protein